MKNAALREPAAGTPDVRFETGNISFYDRFSRSGHEPVQTGDIVETHAGGVVPGSHETRGE